MDAVLNWLSQNWISTVAALYVLDKIVKFTPTKYDDFVVDVVKDVLKILTGRKKVDR